MLLLVRVFALPVGGREGEPGGEHTLGVLRKVVCDEVDTVWCDVRPATLRRDRRPEGRYEEALFGGIEKVNLHENEAVVMAFVCSWALTKKSPSTCQLPFSAEQSECGVMIEHVDCALVQV